MTEPIVVIEQRVAGVRVRRYEPREPRATLVWAHGGSFVRGTLDWPEADWVSNRFAEAGMRVYSVDYTLASDEVKAPIPADDVAAVLREVLAWHDDPVMVGGASAGAHLATAAALVVAEEAVRADQAVHAEQAAQDSAPAAAVNGRGVSALALVYPTLHRVQRSDETLATLTAALPEARRFDATRIAQMYDFYLGTEASVGAVRDDDSLAGDGKVAARGKLAERRKAAKAAKGAEAVEMVGELPRERLSLLPPTVMVNAYADDLRASGEQFAEQLREAGVRVTTHTQADTVHGFLNRPDESPQARRDAVATIEFMAAELGAIHELSVQEPEIAGPASLTQPNGQLNREAVGWATQPIVDTSGIRRGRGRNKRWEYWNIATPTHIIGVTVSHIDYACVHEVWVYDRETGDKRHKAMTVLPPRGTVLAARLEHGRSMARAADLAIDIDELVADSTARDGADAGTRLRVEMVGVSLDVVAELPKGHERLALVVPWSDTRFQYTVKDLARPARGTLTIDGIAHEIGGSAGEAWAVLDHGRGRWPYDIRWNWGAASGRSGDHVFGLQVGAKWTARTGVSENAFFIDGRMHKIHGETRWHYDDQNWLAPWRVIGGGLDATLVPFTNKVTRTDLLVLQSHTDQCFGLWHGTFETAEGELFEFDGLIGWAEEVHNRW